MLRFLGGVYLKKVIVDTRISKKCESALISLGHTVIKLPPDPVLPPPVASHPDMLLFLYRDKLITHKDYYSIAKNELERIGKEIILTDEPIGNKYPNDILFNALHLGEHLIGKMEFVSDKIKALPLKQLNINQGYAKCSSCIVSESALITSDPSVEAAAKKLGVDVLVISHGHIALAGYDTGFIGGASGVCDDLVTFCGNIDLHPDAEAIKIFCESHGKKAISLSDEPLYDLGTLFFI